MIEHYNTNIPINNFNNFKISGIDHKGKIIHHTFDNFNFVYNIFIKKIAIGKLYGIIENKNILLKVKKEKLDKRQL